jgi:hypothetical protein
MVFEKSTASLLTTRRGAGLGLDVNGQKALKAIQPGVCVWGGVFHLDAFAHNKSDNASQPNSWGFT